MKAREHFAMPGKAIFAAFLFSCACNAEDFTLSDNALMTMITQTNRHVSAKSSIVERRDVPGPGVEFDIYFPAKQSYFDCVTTRTEPNNPLFAYDVNIFDHFALKFTLLAINGDSTANHKDVFTVGADIDGGFRPESVSLDPCTPIYPPVTNTAISRTVVDKKEIFSIGIMINNFGRASNEMTITMLVEPAPGAVVIPAIPEKRPPNVVGRIIYVDCNAVGSNIGSGWADAFKNLQDALAAASKGDQIWAASGVYKPNQGVKQPVRGEQNTTFTLKSGVAIYGGFPSGGGKWEESNPSANETILSGDLNGDDAMVVDLDRLTTDSTRKDNVFRVITASGTDETALLDGFIITGGNAGGSGSDVAYEGGGLYSKAGSPTITNCVWKLNSAAQGGAVYFWKSNSRFINCIFMNNYAGDSGGAIHGYESNPTIINCVFTRNTATEKGGAIYNEYSRAKIVNCTITKNQSYAGGGVYNHKSMPMLINCILWANTSRYGADEPGQVYGVKVEASYCFIQGLTEQLGGKICFAKDPRMAEDGYHFLTGSPCVDAGDNKAIPDDIGSDIDNNPRITGAAVDIGAIEAR